MPPYSDQDPHSSLSAGATAVSSETSHQQASAHEPQQGGNVVRAIVIVLVLLAAGGFIWWRLRANNEANNQENNKATAAANRPTPVQYAQVEIKTVPVFLTALGTVTAYNTVTLHTRVDGQLLQVNFQEGQTVHKGQLLLQIDPNPYQAAVDQAVGNLIKDEANLKNMQAEAERYTSLYEAGVVSKESQQLQVSNAGQAEGSIAADKAAIEAAKVNLAYTKIYSPIDGVVGLRQVDPGNIVHAADTTGLVVITQIHPIAIIFTLPEDQLPQVQAAMKGGRKLSVEAYDRADSHLIATGSLLTIDNQIDTTTGTAKLKAVFENADNGLFSNQFVNVRLILSERQNAIVVPTASISSGTQGDFVYTINPGPTPAEKLKNIPPAPSGRHGGGNKSSGSSAATATPSDSGAEGASGATGETTGRQKQPPQHVDTVSVHVDFTIDTHSVISNTTLKGGEKVVVDGQEKLVDGSNVSTPQDQAGRKGVQGSSGATSSTGSLTPQSPGSSKHSHGGGTQ